jgi:tRNA nucleotidyltransferase (CCA-adding enzyme)
VLGRHLLALGMEPGPAIGAVLKKVYERQLDGEITNEEEGLAVARDLIGEA